MIHEESKANLLYQYERIIFHLSFLHSCDPRLKNNQLYIMNEEQKNNLNIQAFKKEKKRKEE
jgi:hypothetical protein